MGCVQPFEKQESCVQPSLKQESLDTEHKSSFSPPRFVRSTAWKISDGGRQFHGCWFSDPGPNYARCSPIKSMAKEDGTSGTDCTFIVRITDMTGRYASCSVGIHSEVDRFWGERKSRIGEEYSVHGHQIVDYGDRRLDHIPKNNRDPPKFVKGDVVKVCFDAKYMKLYWWHNGVAQTVVNCTSTSKAVKTEMKRNEPDQDDADIKWCFYVRGVRMVVKIEDEDLTDEEYKLLQK